MTTNHPRLPAAILAIVSIGGILAGCATTSPGSVTRSPDPTPSASTGAPPTAVAPDGDLTIVTSGLTTPWSIAFVGDTPLISERDTGNILELTGNSTRVIGRVADVVQLGESGLLGIAIDDQRRLYAYSTGPDGNRIQRFTLTGAPGSLTLDGPETILDGIPAASYHDGGRIAFGPDGMLYATTGDAGQSDAAQNLDSLAGKILRMTPTATHPPTIRSLIPSSTVSGTGTPKASPGTPPGDCSPRSSGRTPGMS